MAAYLDLGCDLLKLSLSQEFHLSPVYVTDEQLLRINEDSFCQYFDDIPAKIESQPAAEPKRFACATSDELKSIKANRIPENTKRNTMVGVSSMG